jgi:hypothetical protein
MLEDSMNPSISASNCARIKSSVVLACPRTCTLEQIGRINHDVYTSMFFSNRTPFHVMPRSCKRRAGGNLPKHKDGTSKNRRKNSFDRDACVCVCVCVCVCLCMYVGIYVYMYLHIIYLAYYA